MALSAAAIAGIASAGAGAASGILNTGANMWSARLSRENSNLQAQIIRDWEERMSSSAYSRAVEDMKNAGLNPALMYGSGGPASTPSSGYSNSAVGQSQLKTDFSASVQPFLQQEEIRSAGDIQDARERAKMERLLKTAELNDTKDKSIQSSLQFANTALSYARDLKRTEQALRGSGNNISAVRYMHRHHQVDTMIDKVLDKISEDYYPTKL